jgi:hypothetical protein
MIQFGIATIQSCFAGRKRIAQRDTGLPKPRRFAWIEVVERWVGVVMDPSLFRDGTSGFGVQYNSKHNNANRPEVGAVSFLLL